MLPDVHAPGKVCRGIAPPDCEQGDRPGSPVAQLIGGPAPDYKEKARLGSPLTYVGKDAAPFLIMHGDHDDVVPPA